MRPSLRIIIVVGLTAAACTSQTEPTSVRLAPSDAASRSAAPIAASVVGSGHVLRNLTGEDELTTFSYSGIGRTDGSATGEYQYNFRAAGFFIHGTVTCVSTSGNRGWVGGVIDAIRSDDPADQALVGTEIWWIAEDNGQGANDVPDRTTSLLFAVPGLPITAASWCHDQPVRGVFRAVVSGNIQVN
jgi:hypothetical protein